MEKPVPEGWRRCAVLRVFDDSRAEFLPDALLQVATAGRRAGTLLAIGPVAEIAARHGLGDAVPEREPGLLLPAFFDPHFHWVQDDVRTLPKESLLEWLEKWTFPEEARFADPGYAESKAAVFWKGILAMGTVGGLCYSSIHDPALDAAMRHAPEAFRIGNVLMTMECPEALRQRSTEARASVDRGAELFGARYVATPRFAPTTAPEVMRHAARVADEHGLWIQTHLAETPAEIAWVLGIYRKFNEFAGVADYTGIYQRVGVLGSRTVMGHCLHLSASEWDLLAETRTAVASCPTSNAPVEEQGLGSGLFDFRCADRRGVRWALASDIGGGPSLSMFDVMRSFVEQNRRAGVEEADYVRALFRSTAAGADLSGWGHRKGRLEPGFDFDAVRVPLPEAVRGIEDPECVLTTLIGGKNREELEALVQQTFLGGVRVFDREEAR